MVARSAFHLGPSSFLWPTIARIIAVIAVVLSMASAATAASMCDEHSVGFPCDDEEPCTYLDRCTPDGVCVGTRYPCDVTGGCQLASECDGEGGCIITTKPAGETCDDDEPCTGDDLCTAAGTCTGTVLADDTECEDGNVCTATGTCQSGKCVTTPLDAVPCDDGNPCTGMGACLDGNCQAGEAVVDGQNEECLELDPCAREAWCVSGKCAITDTIRDECPAAGPCTEAVCEATGCVLYPLEEGVLCGQEGADPCTIRRCNAVGECIVQPDRVCQPLPVAAAPVETLMGYGTGCGISPDGEASRAAWVLLFLGLAALLRRGPRGARALPRAGAVAVLVAAAVLGSGGQALAGPKLTEPSDGKGMDDSSVLTPSVMTSRMPFASPLARSRVGLGLVGESYSGPERAEFRFAGELDGEMALLNRRLAIGLSARADLHSFSDSETFWTSGALRALSVGLKVAILDDHKGSGLGFGGRLSMLNVEDSGIQMDGVGAAAGLVGTLAFGAIRTATVIAYSYGWSDDPELSVQQLSWVNQVGYMLADRHQLLGALSGVLSIDGDDYSHRSDLGLGYEYVMPLDDSLFRVGVMGAMPLTYSRGLLNIGFLLKASWEG